MVHGQVSSMGRGAGYTVQLANGMWIVVCLVEPVSPCVTICLNWAICCSSFSTLLMWQSMVVVIDDMAIVTESSLLAMYCCWWWAVGFACW